MADRQEDQLPKPGRQAVVLIHGIGEQRPMETLRGFVKTFLAPGTYYSKPDTLSASYELRRIKLRRSVREAVNTDWPETDFYEYYWAHQMYGTRISHVLAWLFRAMFRGARAATRGELSNPLYPKRLRWMLPAVWVVAILAMVLVVQFAVRHKETAIGTGALLAVIGVLWKTAVAPLVRTVITDFIGDAARYMDISPQNVARRYDIIRGGVEMLRKLHEERDEDAEKVFYRYDRVVLVGHSLGSLIAYDVLLHFWPEVNGNLEIDPKDLLSVESFDGGNPLPPGAEIATHTDAARFRTDQADCWRRINSWWLASKYAAKSEAVKPGRGRWLVTDLVTLGCPMTYAPLLMADDLEDLAEKKSLRELLTCPPDRSKHLNKGRFSVQLKAEANRIVSFPILPQGAMFATTRWTNFFFENDPVGGSLAPVFLNGIEDVGLNPKEFRWRPISAHINYWTKTAAAEPCVAHLRGILTDPIASRGPRQPVPEAR